MKLKKIIIVFGAILFFSCGTVAGLEREFRGVWVATVVNIDWPKNGSDTSEKQKEDFLELLTFYEKLNFNTMIVQVRTSGDAFYPTELAPWSRFITGKEGQPKEGFEDPLEWMIDQTHQRGMQIHAWMNPYRATFDLDTTILDQSHDFFKHPEWMVKYGKKYYYNPGIPEVWKHLTQVVEEVVINYNVDGIHFDDYFYPYKINGELFNDSLSYAQKGIPEQSLGDWRRSNIDSLVKNVHQAIKTHKPWVQFGISPFGVWKNKSSDSKGSETRAGQTTYEDLYADPLLWMEQDWLDYIVPQVYWSMDYAPASHRKITKWWANNSINTKLYIGNGAYKVKNNPDDAWNKTRELPKQLQWARCLPKVEGNVFFSAKSLPQHVDISKKISRRFYKLPADVPVSQKNIKRNVPKPMIISNELVADRQHICLSHYDSIPRFLSVYRGKKRKGRLPKLMKKVYLPANESRHCFELKKIQRKMQLVVKDALGNESPSICLEN